MDARQQDYHSHALSSPYTQFSPSHSEPNSSEQASSSGHYQQHVKYETDSARPGALVDFVAQAPRTFPESQTRYPPQQAQAHALPGHAAMAQSNPSIAASSPTYPPHPQYSPYPPQQEMPQYQAQQGAPMYAPRPDWAGHYGPPPVYQHMPATGPGAAPGMTAQVPRPPPVYYAPAGQAHYQHADGTHQGGHPLSTVYSFVPIPGAQQHKRPRRRYEEIERMYKCGYNGCEKAYGTLNHLNAHVTMQSHGTKRTPEEFKEIRKEWKAKKKEDDHSRKQEEERQRAEGRPVGPEGTPTQPNGQYPPTHMMAPPPQLPPIGYAPVPGQAPPQYAGPQSPTDGQAYQAQGQMYAANGYPPSPYGQQPQMYQQRA